MSHAEGSTPALKPAALLAQSKYRFPGESPEYRKARNALLEQEIELRRQIERVAAMRRALPLGGAVPQDYRFEGEHGATTLSAMFGNHDTLVVYNWMFGPRRERPCPMCTSFLSALDGEARDVEQRVALAVVGRSPIDRLVAFKQERGWRHLRLFSSGGNTFNLDYAHEDPETGDNPAINVFVRSNGSIHHFYGGEMGPETADPGQDPRGAPDLMPLWTILDLTPGGRGTDWYPKFDYPDAHKATLR